MILIRFRHTLWIHSAGLQAGSTNNHSDPALHLLFSDARSRSLRQQRSSHHDIAELTNTPNTKPPSLKPLRPKPMKSNSYTLNPKAQHPNAPNLTPSLHVWTRRRIARGQSCPRARVNSQFSCRQSGPQTASDALDVSSAR